jgi:error-prone DNA polymerase
MGGKSDFEPPTADLLGTTERNMGCGMGGERGGHNYYISPGVHREQVTRRDYRRGTKTAAPLPYVELRAASAFSFLDGASLPEDLMDRAAALDLPAVALLDRNGVYGAPRFYQAAKQAGVRALVGAEICLEGISGTGYETQSRAPSSRPNQSFATCPRNSRLSVLVASRTGYRNLCRLLTAAAARHPKGGARAAWAQIDPHIEGLWCLTGGEESPLARTLETEGIDAARALLERLVHRFDGRVHVEVQRHGRRDEERRNRALVDLARSLRLPLVATNGVRYARREDKRLHDVVTAIRHHTTLDQAGTLLAAQSERHLKGAAAMARLFPDHPEAVSETAALAARLDFTLADLGYRFPDFPVPKGETQSSYLRHITWNAARTRFRPLTARAQDQIQKELALIEKLELAGYFLIVWDIVRFCLERGMLVQGRGSAANSAVCYALSITAVDPVKMELLFERFLSEERGEWPDIDLDLPSGDQREAAIQYVYKRYAPTSAGGDGLGSGAAMTANVITYRDRSAAREVAKVLGFPPEQVDKLSKRLGSWSYDAERGDHSAHDHARPTADHPGSGGRTRRAPGSHTEPGASARLSRELSEEIRKEGFDPEEPRLRLLFDLWRRIQNIPRHLGQHSGGMVISAGRLDEVVPVEPATMPGRTVVQWDKDDCSDLGIIKVDLLGLGMLNAMERMIPMIRAHEKVEVDLAHLPPDDPEVYRMLRAADTVGVFQVESRAQMASLPRNAPTKFYDLVVQVAIIRPGPIVGGMVHPFFERRLGREEVVYPHPSLEPILKRTLGVPLFQEQLLRIAMVAAGFTGGEAEELRRAMGFKRSQERMVKIEEKLRRGMAERGILGAAQDQIVQSITSFALYGFPESHAASFALIAYASAWLRCHHPTAFYAGLLNAWPMGFYHPATLIKDAQRLGVEVRAVDVNRSDWDCTWEENERKKDSGKEQGRNGATFAHPNPPPVDRPPLGHAFHREPAAGNLTAQGSPARSSFPPHARGALRLGLRYVRGLREAAAKTIEAERHRRPFSSLDDLKRRCALRADELDVLAESGTLASFGMDRRAALWQVAWVSRSAGPLLDRESAAPPRTRAATPLPEMSSFEKTLADFRTTGVTVGRHPIEYVRPELRRRGILAAADLAAIPNGERVRTAGSVIVRQRPGTASGTLFITLEDETGMSQAIVHRDLLRRHRALLVGSPALVVEGVVQQRDGSISVRGEKFWALGSVVAVPSHDFH